MNTYAYFYLYADEYLYIDMYEYVCLYILTLRGDLLSFRSFIIRIYFQIRRD